MVEIGYLIDDNIHDIFITNVQSIKNETLIEAKRKADLYKENEFIELTDIFSTEFRTFFDPNFEMVSRRSWDNRMLHDAFEATLISWNY